MGMFRHLHGLPGRRCGSGTAFCHVGLQLAYAKVSISRLKPDRSHRSMRADLPAMKTCCDNSPLSGTTPEEVSHARNFVQIDLKNEVASIRPKGPEAAYLGF